MTNAFDTMLSVSYQGKIISFEVGGEINQESLCPIRYSMIASTTENDDISINMNRNGEIIILQNKQLIFSKRRGNWQYYSNNTLYNMIKSDDLNIYPAIRKSIYQSSLDVSFARTGGCIGIIEDQYLETIKRDIIKDGDSFSEPKNEKSLDLYQFVKDMKFHEIDRRIRSELMGIDGAIVLDKQGNILTMGSIINISEKSEDGARTAATKTLARYGIAIKISMDGEIKIYKRKNNSIEMAYRFA